MKSVSVFMDVEDTINLRSDDAALDMARLLTAHGVRASLCVTGEKCRTLMARGRTDVLEALSPHCLGLHTDTHSFHPTTMELLADLSYEEGCAAAYAVEKRGFDAFVEAFGRSPAFWGGAGNTWSPEIADAIRRLGIPAYAYALTSLPGEAVHRFNGVFALPQGLAISELEWADDDAAAIAGERTLGAIADFPAPWVGVFVGHPTKLRHTRYWDTPFFAGRTPPSPEESDPLPLEVYERSKRNLAAFLDRLPAVAEVVGVDDLTEMPWKFRKPTEAEISHFSERSAEMVRGAGKWPVHRQGLSSENIVQKTLALVTTLAVGELGS